MQHIYCWQVIIFIFLYPFNKTQTKLILSIIFFWKHIGCHSTILLTFLLSVDVWIFCCESSQWRRGIYCAQEALFVLFCCHFWYWTLPLNTQIPHPTCQMLMQVCAGAQMDECMQCSAQNIIACGTCPKAVHSVPKIRRRTGAFSLTLALTLKVIASDLVGHCVISLMPS